MNLISNILMNIYSYDNESMALTKVAPKKVILFLSSIIFLLMLLSFWMGTLLGRTSVAEKKVPEDKNFVFASKYDINPEHDMAWKDSVFEDYKVRADLFLSRPIFEGTPLNGEILSLCARNAYDSTGILLPLELALSQGQWESGMGREGKSPKKNPFNVGENDSGTVIWFESTFEGTQAYYYYMCNDYLRCRTVDELLSNFVNCSGKRYATGLGYEEKIRGSYYNIKNWFNKNKK